MVDVNGAEQFWETRYADSARIWSGRPNEALVSVAAELPAGRALDLGCGEGADSIWLALRGWQVTGLDISETALARAAAAAADSGVPDGRIRWVAHDLASPVRDAVPTEAMSRGFDLVAACFLHSPVDFPRTQVLREAAAVVAAGGALLIVSHAAFPPWSTVRHAGEEHHGHGLLRPREEAEALALPEAEWTVAIAETRSRAAIGPNGEHAILDDGVLLLKRTARR